MKEKNKEVLTIGLIIILLLLFPYQCPVQHSIGIPCPSCNMTTSAYWFFLKGDIKTSLYYHAMLIPTCMTIGLLFITYLKKKYKWTRKILFIWAIVMIIYYLYRMIFIFPNPPMNFDDTSILTKIIYSGHIRIHI